MAEQICPACGCAVSGSGYDNEGKTYCCEPCASSSSSCECGCCHSCEDHEEHK